MTRGTITNKQTGLEVTGETMGELIADTFEFTLDGSTRTNTFNLAEWDFTPEPEPIKDGVYSYKEGEHHYLVLYKYREGTWRDAFGYELEDQNVDVSELVRLVPEA